MAQYSNQDKGLSVCRCKTMAELLLTPKKVKSCKMV